MNCAEAKLAGRRQKTDVTNMRAPMMFFQTENNAHEKPFNVLLDDILVHIFSFLSLLDQVE
jgi:hypothetical protein